MRHPIYTGLFLGSLGVALRAYTPRNVLILGLGILWFLIKSENFLRADIRSMLPICKECERTGFGL